MWKTWKWSPECGSPIISEQFYAFLSFVWSSKLLIFEDSDVPNCRWRALLFERDCVWSWSLVWNQSCVTTCDLVARYKMWGARWSCNARYKMWSCNAPCKTCNAPAAPALHCIICPGIQFSKRPFLTHVPERGHNVKRELICVFWRIFTFYQECQVLGVKKRLVDILRSPWMR